MPLGVISRVSFGFWGDFWRKIAKREKPEKSGQKPQRGMPRRGEAGHPSGMPQRSSAMPWHRHYSQRENFGFLFSNTSYSYTDSLRTLIDD